MIALIETTKEQELKRRFVKSNGYVLVLSRQSNEYKYFKDTIESLTNKGHVQMIQKIRQKYFLKLNRCFGNESGLKNFCTAQCDACKILQETSETVQSKVYQVIDKHECNKALKPSKLRQIINIIFKK